MKHHRNGFAGGAGRIELRRIEWALRCERKRCQKGEHDRKSGEGGFHSAFSETVNILETTGETDDLLLPDPPSRQAGAKGEKKRVSVGSEYRDDTARQPLLAHPNKMFRTTQADHPPCQRSVRYRTYQAGDFCPPT